MVLQLNLVGRGAIIRNNILLTNFLKEYLIYFHVL
jgi:hypothetical protein